MHKMPLIGLLILVGLNFLLAIGMKVYQSWEKADVLYIIRESYKEGRKKLILGG